jgi:dynactin complex subunit
MVGGVNLGVVRFVGTAEFSSGEWVGVELFEPGNFLHYCARAHGTVGKNDGSVGAVRYFTCQPLHGIFCPPAKVSAVADPRFSVGDRVFVGTQDRCGVVRFVGPTKFALGQWVGITLDQPRECSAIIALASFRCISLLIIEARWRFCVISIILTKTML